MIVTNGFLFLQEIHSAVNDYIKWKDDFKDGAFYSHGKSNSSVVLIDFIHFKKLIIRNNLSGNDGHILILVAADINEESFILIKLYNPNTEAEQLKTLSKLMEMLTKLRLTQNNYIICVGDLDFLFNVKLEHYRGNAVYKKNVLSEKYFN